MRITLTTFGSYGDLHPTIALALALQKAGHSVLIGTSAAYQQKIERAGIPFVAIRPDQILDETLVVRALDPFHGPVTVIRDLMDAVVEETYADIEKLLERTDLFITSPLSIATVLVATKHQVPWISTVLAPTSFFSVYDPPVFPNLLWARRLLKHAPRLIHRAVLKLGRLVTYNWWLKTRKLKQRQHITGLENPIFSGQFSPLANLALFSKTLGQPQPDWPKGTIQTGFLFYDKEESSHLSNELRCFIESGAAPIVFTLGSIMMMDARDFFIVAAEVAIELKQRAVIIYGKERHQNIAALSPHRDIYCCDYAPYSEVFPLGSVVVHQGGVGTSAQVMRAGVPALVIPFSFDQPDNAYRMQRRGTSRTIERKKLTKQRMKKELQEILSNPSYRNEAQLVKEMIAKDDGEHAAVLATESAIMKLSTY